MVNLIDSPIPVLLDILNGANESPNNKIYESLKNKQNLKVLDLGCRVPTYLIMCYHQFNTSFVKGVELAKNEIQCILDLGNHLITSSNDAEFESGEQLIESCSGFYDYYNRFWKPCSNSNKLIKLIESDFNEIILNNIEFDKKLETYISESEAKFDVIICQNVLHFTNQNELLISKIASLLKSDGFIYIKVENQSKLTNPNKRTYYDREKFIQELNQNFNKGFIYQSDKNDDWDSLVFINQEL